MVVSILIIFLLSSFISAQTSTIMSGGVNEPTTGTGASGVAERISGIENTDSTFFFRLALTCKDPKIYGDSNQNPGAMNWIVGSDQIWPVVWGASFYGVSDATLPLPQIQPFATPDWDQNLELTFDWNNILTWRYEGLCTVMSRAHHNYYALENSERVRKADHDTGWAALPESYRTGVNLNHVSPISWDTTEEACTKYGGAWLNNNEYGNYQCCGDDHIWIYNKEVTYPRPLDSPWNSQNFEQGTLCYYSDINQNGIAGGFSRPADLVPEDYEEQKIFSATRSPDDTLICGPVYSEAFGTLRHKTYDPAIRQHYDANIAAKPSIFNKFYFEGDLSQGNMTDVGIWSNQNGDNPLFCDYTFDSAHGRTYSWKNLSEAGEKNKYTCENLLGATWTGSHCCGNELKDNNPMTVFSESYNDPVSTTPIPEGFAKACVQGSAVANKELGNWSEFNTNDGFDETTRQPIVTQIRAKVLNLNGTLYSCNAANDVTSSTDFYTSETLLTPKDQCYYTGELTPQVHKGFVCSVQRNWADLRNTSLHQYFNFPADKETDLKTSTLGLDPRNSECCFNYGCWNGISCVPAVNDTATIPEWGDGLYTKDPDTPNQQTYMCLNNNWQGPLQPKYNWFDYNESKGYCPQSFSCYCEGDSCGTDPEFVQRLRGTSSSYGCTNKPNFFVDDHYCEAVQDEDGNVVGSNWTSRTKFIALQLMELAGNNDYELFCDYYQRNLNDFGYVREDNTVYDVLNALQGTMLMQNPTFCSVHYTENGNEKTVLAFPLKTDMKMQIADEEGSVVRFANEHLLEDSQDENLRDNLVPLNSCYDAVHYETTAPHGEFVKCEAENNFVFYNNKLKAVLFSRDGFDTVATSVLSTASQPVNNALLATEARKFQDFIATHPEAATATHNGNALWYPQTLDAFNFTRDFNRVYLNKKQGTIKAFGFVETKNTFHTRTNDPNLKKVNKEYLGVYLDPTLGNDVNCGNITRVFGNSFCSIDNGKLFIIGKYPEGTLQNPLDTDQMYWQELTSQLRIS